MAGEGRRESIGLRWPTAASAGEPPTSRPASVPEAAFYGTKEQKVFFSLQRFASLEVGAHQAIVAGGFVVAHEFKGQAN